MSHGFYHLQLHVYKKMLADAATRTQNIRAKRKRAKNEVENRNLKIEEWKMQIEELKQTYEDVDNRRINIAERTKQLEGMIEVIETRVFNTARRLFNS